MILLFRRALTSFVCVIFAASLSSGQERLFSNQRSSRATENSDQKTPQDGIVGPEIQTTKSLPLVEAGANMQGGSEDRLGRNSNTVQSAIQMPESVVEPSQINTAQDSERFRGSFARETRRFGVGTDLYAPPEFKDGLIVFGKDVAMKIGGYVKTDFIYDFTPIDSTDSFATTSIPVGAPGRTNTRFHARQSRMSFDTRWASSEQTVRVFVEGDFFSSGNALRLRQAYGQIGPLLVGQTWTTFTDVASAPATLDFEGSVSSVNRRQAMVRWTGPVLYDDLTLAIAAENPQFNIIPPVGITGDARSPSPDFIAALRLSKEWGQFQMANLYRLGGFQPDGGRVTTGSAWGINFTGAVLLSDVSKVYSQFVFGDGIGSYRGLPDAAPDSATTDQLLGLTGWMVGYTRDWTDRVSTNFTYAENALSNASLQPPSDVHRTTYLASNVIWKPYDRVKVGVEYLYGLRENVDREVGVAHRLQIAFIFDLP